MNPRPRVFLDTSALFAGVWSPTGGARQILRLGEAGAVQVLISPIVLAELESVLRRKAPEVLAALALLLDRSQVEIVQGRIPEIPGQLPNLVSHPNDACILATALQAGADYFATLDRKHLLDNQPLQAALPIPLGTPGDFLAWLRARFTE